MSDDPLHPTPRDISLERQIEKLYQLSIYRRWLFISLCWLSLGLFGLWGLRESFALGLEHFTWAVVRYSVVFSPVPSLCLGFCVSVTVAALVWQSRNILFGFSPQHRQQLEQQVKKIRAAGERHPLWKRVCQ